MSHISLKPLEKKPTDEKEREVDPLVANELEIRKLKREMDERVSARDTVIERFQQRMRETLDKMALDNQALRAKEEEVLDKLNIVLDRILAGDTV